MDVKVIKKDGKPVRVDIYTDGQLSVTSVVVLENGLLRGGGNHDRIIAQEAIDGKFERQERVEMLKDLLDNLNRVVEVSPHKGKALQATLRSYAAGWSDRSGETPDPIIYFALLRGGDPRPEIESGIKLITDGK